MAKLIKTSMNLPERSIEIVKHISNQTGSSMAEVVRKAIEIEKLMYDASQEGSKILIQKQDNSIRELILR